LISGPDVNDLKARAEAQLVKHKAWLESIGMVVNVDKTEAVLFGKPGSGINSLDIDGTKITLATSMKVLGVLFDSSLSWNEHVDKVVKLAKKCIQGLRILRRNLSADSYMQVINAQFFSKLYYGSAVWLSAISKANLKRIDTMHYQALRLCYWDFRNEIPREIIDHDLKRAVPQEWASYSTAKELIRIFNTGTPPLLFSNLRSQSYLVQRPQRVLFYDVSQRKVGSQCFPNRVASLSKRLDFDWHFGNLNSDQIRVGLKESLFKYPSTTQCGSKIYFTGKTITGRRRMGR